MTSADRSLTLLGAILPVPASLSRGRVRAVALVALGVAFLALLAQLRVQIGPVPITGQTLGVLLLGAAYGARLGAATTGAYLLLGAVGLPLFTGGQAGLGYVMGPTGGYLVGFVAAAALLGTLAERGWDRSVRMTALAMLLASLVVYACGLAWLHVALNGAGALGEGWARTLQVGLLPFLAGDAVKLAVATLLLPAAWRLSGRG